MRRAAFLWLAAAPLLAGRAARAQSDVDPASSASRQALRVLLGSGDAAPASADTFLYEGRAYRGNFTRTDDGRVVNVVDLEAYLASVVPAEMSPSWPAAALEAQAICARTYVLSRSDPRRAYDLVPSELDQVYRGVAGESAAATAAVGATAGQVLHAQSGFARVAYSSCCGGHTESAAELWGGPPIPYLEGVACNWCAGSPNYRWSVVLALTDLASSFSTQLAAAGPLLGLSVAGRDASGRARAFSLSGRDGDVLVPGGLFRRTLGVRTLRSLLVFEVDGRPGDSAVALRGGGLGHGVGLCQWGARGLALAGGTPGQILGAYFPGTVVADLDR